MQEFDEQQLLLELATLTRPACSAFALAAATRQISSFDRYAIENGIKCRHRLHETVYLLWADLQSARPDSQEMCRNWLDEVMRLLPGEAGEWNLGVALADDALSSLAYAIRSMLSDDPQESVWAARRAYEAADQAAIRALGVQPGVSDVEATIRSHSFVQRELGRQRRDLDLLRSNFINEVRELAQRERLLTDEESSCIDEL